MSAKIDDGGYIIPIPCPSATDGREFDGGLTVRDWFAGQAQEKDIERHMDVWDKSTNGWLPQTREAAKYRYADAMLAARKERAT